jgi:DNA-binding NarL/FixJ family response regulator
MRGDPETSHAANIVTDARGRILHASVAAMAWLEMPGFREGLAQLVRTFDRNIHQGDSEVLHRARVRLVRLEGDEGVRYLAVVTTLPRVETTPFAQLPPMQQRIAKIAATGASIRDIASELGRSENTIKTQLRLAYERLGVSSRLELARLIDSQSGKSR